MIKNIILLTLLAVVCMCEPLFAQKTINFWSAVSSSVVEQNRLQNNHPVFVPQEFKAFRLSESALRQSLVNVPLAKKISVDQSSFVISIPNTQGTLERFRIVEAPVLSAVLAAKYPQLKSYSGRGIDDPSATIHFDVTTKGFHAMVLSDKHETVYINPADKNNGLYVVFERSDTNTQKSKFTCIAQDGIGSQQQNFITHKNADDGILRTYRFAVPVGGQFSQLCLDGTETTDAEKKASVLSTLVTDLNRINGIFERDLDVHLNYVDNEDTIIFLDSNTDPFVDNTSTGFDDGKWSTQSKKTLDKYIGNSNYDCGHLLMGLNTGGNAGCIGCVCDSSKKGIAVTGTDNPSDDPFVVDFWTHEIGHQFGATHTFDYTDEGTGTQVEPGSGSTIMSYAGTTGSTDVQSHSDDYFHAMSIQQITDYIKSIDGAPGPTLQPTSNHTPTANAGTDYTIPAATPFMLTGSASDSDSADVLSYTWEQMDGISNGYNEFPQPSTTGGPVFRSFKYSSSAVRTFPVLDTILAGKTAWKWEAVPSVSRSLHFRFTVRDNHAGGGSNNSDDVKVTVDSTAGPFIVTGLDSATHWKGNSQVIITWNVANTNNTHIQCSNVTIQFSNDGGHTFPITLKDSTPNDGIDTIVVPNKATATGRIRVMAANNIFFDISNANISITPVVLPITWLSFTANRSTNGVLLNWSTANDTNDTYFDVERSSDGVNFTTIYTVTAGNHQYSYEDLQPGAGVNYYRINQVDENNANHYSAVATVDMSKVIIAVIYPNPARDMMHIRLNENSTRLIITLTDATGKILYTTTASSVVAGQTIPVHVARLAAGVYFVKVKWDKGTVGQQLLVN